MKIADRVSMIKVWLKNSFPIYMKLFSMKLFEILLSSLVILLALGLLNYEYTLRNYMSCVALYFIIEELEIVQKIKLLLQVRRK